MNSKQQDVRRRFKLEEGKSCHLIDVRQAIDQSESRIPSPTILRLFWPPLHTTIQSIVTHLKLHSTELSPHQWSWPANLPIEIANTDFFTGLLVIIVPFTLWKVDAGKRCWRLGPRCLPFPLERSSRWLVNDVWLPMNGSIYICLASRELTSGLKSVNSSPRQSIAMIFCPLRLLSCSASYKYGPSTIDAECVFYNNTRIPSVPATL